MKTALFCLVAAHLVGATGAALAATSKVVIFPALSKETPAAEIVAAVTAQVEALSSTEPRLVSGNALEKKLKGNPADFLAKCKGKLPCISKLIKKARAERGVLLRVARTEAAGVEITLGLLTAKKAKLDGSASFTVATAPEVAGALSTRLAELLQMPSLAAPAAPAVATEAPKVEPAPVASPPAAPLVVASEATAPPPPTLVETAPRPVPRRRGVNTALLATGLTLAILGAGGAGAGTYFGVQTNSTRGSITDATPQTLVAGRTRAANISATQANILWGVGGGVALIGLVLIGTSFAVGQQASVALTPLAGGAHVAYGATW